jgi:hypothetical protein
LLTEKFNWILFQVFSKEIERKNYWKEFKTLLSTNENEKLNTQHQDRTKKQKKEQN